MDYSTSFRSHSPRFGSRADVGAPADEDVGTPADEDVGTPADEDVGTPADETSAPREYFLGQQAGLRARSADAGARSGVILDALHLVSAERAKTDVLLTFHESDFNRLAPQIDVRQPTASIGRL